MYVCGCGCMEVGVVVVGVCMYVGVGSLHIIAFVLQCHKPA